MWVITDSTTGEYVGLDGEFIRRDSDPPTFKTEALAWKHIYQNGIEYATVTSWSDGI